MAVDMNEVREKLQYELYYQLIMNSPILSGNMQNMISGLGLFGAQPENNNESCILISAPSYDMARWQKEKVIIHNNKINYAEALNESGAFGSHNDSEHWVNRIVNACCEYIADMYGGQVERRLPD